jgi:type II secretory pathway pseudopilin PulG
MPGNDYKKFTLIELLLVMVVITVLTGLLVPVLSTARNQARKVQCINNMRQIGIAIAAYSCNFDNKFPPWISSLNSSYLSNLGVYHCPFDRNPSSRLPELWLSHNEGKYSEAYDRPKPSGFIYPGGNKRWNSKITRVSYFYEFSDSVCTLLQTKRNNVSWNMFKVDALKHGVNPYSKESYRKDMSHFPVLRCFWHLKYGKEEPVINVSPEGNCFYSTTEWEKKTW